MNPYCTNLNFNIPVFRDSVDLEKFTSCYQMQGHRSDLNPTLLKFLLTKNIKVFFFETFFLLPDNREVIHIDHLSGDYVKLNYVYYGNNSKMNWYKPKDEIKKSISTTPIGTKFISYNKNEVDLLHSQSVGFPGLVQVGIPHSITNPEDKRLCISLVLHNLKCKRLTMNESLEIFKEYIE